MKFQHEVCFLNKQAAQHFYKACFKHLEFIGIVQLGVEYLGPCYSEQGWAVQYTSSRVLSNDEIIEVMQAGGATEATINESVDNDLTDEMIAMKRKVQFGCHLYYSDSN